MEMTSKQQQPVWRALFHPTRRQIIRLLEDKSRTTGELSDFFDVTRYAVMKHLRVLEQAELISVRREGRLRWNVLNRERLQEVPADYLEKWRSAGTDSDEKDGVELEAGVVSLKFTVTLPAAPEEVYRAFLHQIDTWWPDRVMDGSKLVIEPFVGGRFYEAAEDEGAGVLFGFVTCLRPNKEIRFSGPMDAVEEAVTSSVHIRLEKADDQTNLHLTHRTVGEVDESLNPLYANDWEERLDQGLRAFVTEGSPTATVIDR